MTTTDRLALAGLLLGLTLGAACTACSSGGARADDDPPGEPDDPPAAAGRPAVTLTAQVALGADGVRATYRLANRGGTALLVPDRLPVPAGNGVRYSRGSAYVVGEGARSAGRIEVGLRVFARPAGVELAQEPVVGVTRVAPGATLTGTVRVGLVRRQPYGDDLGHGPITLPDPVRSVRLCLGVLPAALPPAADRGRADDVRLVAHGDPAAGVQHLVCTRAVAGP